MQATHNAPQLAMRFLFDMQSVREVVSREDLPEIQRSSERRGLALGRTTTGLLNAGLRLIELLDAPEDIPFLKHLIDKEIGDHLGTSEQVVKNKLRSIYDKTGVSDRLELALFTLHHRAMATAAAEVATKLQSQVKKAADTTPSQLSEAVVAPLSNLNRNVEMVRA